jgi:hypothetical protein
MKTFKLYIFICFILILPELLKAQKSEVGVTFTLSGHLIFGPYYRYWFDNHNELDIGILATYEGKIHFPQINAGYHYYFNDRNWRPSIGGQYSFAPGIGKSKGNSFQMFSIVPGIQYRFNNYNNCIEELIWISYFNLRGKKHIFPTGLETKFGMSL